MKRALSYVACLLCGIAVGVLIMSAVYQNAGLRVPAGSAGAMVSQPRAVTAAPASQPTETPTPAVVYIGNRRSGVFHKPSCSSVSQMNSSNKVPLYSRQQAIDDGYRPCGRCHP